MDNLSIINTSSGEIIGSYTPKFSMSHMEFVLFFGKNLAMLGKANPSKKEIILASIISKMDGDNVVYILKNFRMELSKKLEINPSYVGRVVDELIEKQILYKIGRGVYIVNPYIYGKGNVKNIAKLRWEFEAIFKNDTVEMTHSVKRTYKEKV